MILTKDGKVPAATIDRWLRWYNRCERIASNEDYLRHHDDSLVAQANERLKRERDRWKVPEGFSSWEAIESKLIETGQTSPMLRTR